MLQLIGQIVGYLLVTALFAFVIGWLYGRTRAARLGREREAELLEQLRAQEQTLNTITNERTVFETQKIKLERELAATQTLLRAREQTVSEQSAKLKDQQDLLRRLAEKDGELTRLRWRLSELEQRYGPGGNLPVRNGPTVPYEDDDLKRIRGVGIVSADLLKRMSISTFRQVAQWTDGDLRRVAELLNESPERLRQQNWVGQAREQHRLKYGEAI